MTNESLGSASENRNNGVDSSNTGATAAMQDAARKLGAQAAEVGGQVYRQAVDAGRYAGRQVEEQPWTAAIASGIVCMLVGFLLGRASMPEPRSARDYVDEYLPRNLRQR